MKRLSVFWLGLALSLVVLTATADSFPKISSTPQSGWFPLTDAAICTDASRSLPVSTTGSQRLRIYLLDPGIVLQEILIHGKGQDKKDDVK